jgi:hypothetical protein
MKKFLISFLMLVMLTPGLACGPFMIMAKAQAAQVAQGMEDCHGMSASDSSQETSNNDHVFFKDCSKIDLQSADNAADLKAPEVSGKTFSMTWEAIAPADDVTLLAENIIRGPPPDWPDLSGTQPPILLTTHRFRE